MDVRERFEQAESGFSAPPPRDAREVFRRGRQRRQRRIGALSAVTALVATLAVVIGIGSGPGPQLPEIGDRPDTTAPTEQGPVADADAGVEIQELDLAAPVPLRVLAARFNNPSLALIDLDSRELRQIRAGTHGLAGDALGGGLILADGTVVIWQDDTVRAFADGLGRATFEHVPDTLINPPGAAPSLRVVPSVDGDALWVVQIGSCCPDAVDGRAELVDLASGEVLQVAELPPSTFPVAATPDGLLLNTRRSTETPAGFVDEPGSQRTLLLGGEGTVSEFVPGAAVAVSGSTALIELCEPGPPRGGCELDLVDTRTSVRRRVERPVAGAWGSASGPVVTGEHTPWSTTAPDGRILATIDLQEQLEPKPSESHLVIIDPEQGDATVAASFDGPAPPATWDRDGRHIVLVDGPNLTILDPAADTTSVLRDLLPSDHHAIAVG